MVRVAYKITKPDGVIESGEELISGEEIVKHFVIAGCGNVGGKKEFRKAKGALIYFEDYFPDNENAKGFVAQTGYLYDPTAKAQFSNLVGKALADYFFKRIVVNGITINYEAMMKIKLGSVKNVSRPDLYGICNSSKVYAIEAKGFTNTTKKKQEHKNQALNAPLHADYHIASVTENIYTKIHVDFYDPSLEEIKIKCTEEDCTAAYYGQIIKDFLSDDNYERVIKRHNNNYIILETFRFKGENIALAILESIVDTISSGFLPKLDRLKSVINYEKMIDKINILNKSYKELEEDSRRNTLLEVFKLYNEELHKKEKIWHTIESEDERIKNIKTVTMEEINIIKSSIEEICKQINRETPLLTISYKNFLSTIEKEAKQNIEDFYKDTDKREREDVDPKRIEIKEVPDYYLDYDGIGIFKLLPNEVSYRINNSALSNKTFKLVRSIN